MNFTLIIIIVIQLCLFVEVSPKGGRGGGGRGGGGRGRGSSGRSSSSRGSSSRGSSGRGFSGRISSTRSKTIALGLVGTYVGYKAGRMTSRITSGHYSTFYYGRTYYYGNRYYSRPTSPEYETCTYNVENNDEYFDLTYNDTGARITEILYTCKAANETCCNGLDCCPKGSTFIVVLLFLLAGITILVMSVCFVRRCRAQNAKWHTTPPAAGYATCTYQPMGSNRSNNVFSTTTTTTSYSTTAAAAGPTTPSMTSGQQMPAYQPAFDIAQYNTPMSDNRGASNFVPNYQLVTGGAANAPAMPAVATNFQDNPPSYGFVIKS